MANYAIVLLATMFISITTRTRILSLVYGLIIIYFLSIAALSIPLVKEATDAFALRWELAAQSEASTQAEGNVEVVGELLQGRVLSKYTAPIVHRDTYPLLGHGIGMGSNIGAVRLSGKRGLLLEESSWGKQMGELGLFVGTIFILWRISLSCYIVNLFFKESFSNKNLITVILASSSLWGVLNGQLGQSSGLGFIVGTTGLTLASTIRNNE